MDISTYLNQASPDELMFFNLHDALLNSNFIHARAIVHETFLVSRDEKTLYSCIFCIKPWLDEFKAEFFTWVSIIENLFPPDDPKFLKFRSFALCDQIPR